MKNIFRLILKPKYLIVIWSIFLLSPLISVFRLLFVINNPIFSMHIKGFSTMLLYLPVLLSLLVTIVLIFWFKEYIDKDFPRSHKKVLTVLTFLSALFLVIARLLLDLEYRNYPNFLYEHFGITVSQLEFMTFITALELLAFISFLIYNKSFAHKNVKNNYDLRSMKFERISLYIAVLGFSSLLVLSANTFLNWNNLENGETGGYETRIGRHYKYLFLLLENTPKDSKVIHPPQGDKWPAIGNQPVIRYFLYPRTLISGTLINNPNILSEINEAYFVEIDSNIKETRWPIIDNSLKTVVFDEKNKTPFKELNVIFNSEEGKVYKIVF